MISRLLSIAVMLLSCAAGTGAAQGARPASSRSAAARDVASARAVYTEVEQAIAAKRLVPRDTTLACDGAPFDVSVTRYADVSGRIRMLSVGAGSDDQSQTTRYYYDAGGRLRFAIATRGAVNGTREDERAWYSPSGGVVRRVSQTTAGLGYPFGEIRAIPNARGWEIDVCR
ncbi:MAG TPA: hypothetical protein VFJ16_15790 [Longimicrobium sp.]|nr:hypothetical protein [Longimicrobium sp.]